MKEIRLNPGAQTEFVRDTEHRYVGYFGGVGSGKSFAGLLRGLQWSDQPVPPGTLWGPWGCVTASTYPMIEDILLPLFFEIVDSTGLLMKWEASRKKAFIRANCGCANKRTCKHRAVMLFRSLDKPNWRRGLNLSWFYIDEGREVTKEAWDVLVGRLRQPGYTHGGWVCSTPNGFDWMYQVFHEESQFRHPDSHWYHATSKDNRDNLDDDFLRDLEASYEGLFYEQEVQGAFVGLLGGASYPHWRKREHCMDVPYDPELPLYSFWDFGVGDLGVCLFAQVAWEVKTLEDKTFVHVPVMRFIGAIEAKDWDAQKWADAWATWCDRHYMGRRPNANFGDPAGRQRNAVTATSMLDAMRAAGVPISPAPKKPADYGEGILSNLMAGGRVIVDKTLCVRLADAFATNHWKTDSNGNRMGTGPVHDWTSHFCDAARYGAMSLLSYYPLKVPGQQKQPPGPGTFGHIVNQILHEPEEWLGGPYSPTIEVVLPGPIMPREF